MPACDKDPYGNDQFIYSMVRMRRTGKAPLVAAIMLLMLLGLNFLAWQPSCVAGDVGSEPSADSNDFSAPQTKYPRTIDTLAWMPDSNSILLISDSDLYSIAANGQGLKFICSGIDFILPGPAGQLLAGDGQSLLGLSLLTGATFPISKKAPAAFSLLAGKGLRRASWSVLSNTAYYGSADGYIMSYEAHTGNLIALEKGLDPQVVSGISAVAGSAAGSNSRAGSVAGSNSGAAPGSERLVFWTTSPTETGQIRIRNLQPVSSGSVSSTSFAPALPPGRSPVWLARNEIAYISSANGNNQLALAKVSPENSTANTANKAGASNTAKATLTYQSAFAFQTIQIAAYSDPEEAAAFMNVCRDLCAPYPIYVVEAEVNHTKWYRIRVGIFRNKTSLNTALNHILPVLKTAAAWDGKYFIATTVNSFGWLCPSPDGTFLIFSLMNAVYRYNNQDLTKLVCLYEPTFYAPENKTNAVLSPDGEKIAFVDESGRLKIMSARGDRLTTILNR